MLLKTSDILFSLFHLVTVSMLHPFSPQPHLLHASIPFIHNLKCTISSSMPKHHAVYEQGLRLSVEFMAFLSQKRALLFNVRIRMNCAFLLLFLFVFDLNSLYFLVSSFSRNEYGF